MTQEGRDVSVWQGAYGFPAVDFTIAKATEGIGYRDPQWSRNQSILLQPGPMVAGSYHFFRGNPNEVDWYLSQHDPAVFHPDVPWIFVLDAEAEGDAGAVNQFLNRLKAAIGYDPWFYSYGAWINARAGIDRSYPLWIAAPSSPVGQPPGYGWAAVTAHQYGTVNGVDANLFLGDRNALLKLAGIGGSQPTPVLEDADMKVVVSSGPDRHGGGKGVYLAGAGWCFWLGTNGEVSDWLSVLDQKEAKPISQFTIDRFNLLPRIEDPRGAQLPMGSELAGLIGDVKALRAASGAAVDIKALAAEIVAALPHNADEAAIADLVVAKLGEHLNRPAA